MPDNTPIDKGERMIKHMASKFTEEELGQIGNYLAEKYPVLKSGSEL